MNFKNIDNRGTVEGYCLIKTVDKKNSSKGDSYLDIMLSDKDGEINAKLWNYKEDIHGSFEANQLVKVRGTVSSYNGNDQLRVERIRCVTSDDGIDPAKFVRTAEYDNEEMFSTLYKIASEFSDEELSNLVTYMLDENKEKLLYWPAAFRLHHAIRGGLLMHTLSIVRMAERTVEVYPFVDRELLISGAILHDIAKLTEFAVTDIGVATGYSVRGNLLGHLAEGAMAVRKAAERIGVSPETSMLIEHMILSHHGEPEFGAAVRPMFIEAELLSELDLMDSRIYEMREAIESSQEGGFTNRLWAMDNRKLYNHSRNDMNKKTKLF